MDEALIQHAQNDIDDNERSQDQNEFVRQCGLECLRVAGKFPGDRARHADLLCALLNGLDSLPERNATAEIEGQGNGGKLILVRHWFVTIRPIILIHGLIQG